MMNLSDEHTSHLGKLEKNLVQCASLTLYKRKGRHIEHVASHTCDHKACMVCNFLRQKKIRRKYAAWFDRNSRFNEIITDKGISKIVTDYQLDKKYPECDVLSRIAYDIMFFTLTVPHTKKGFRGSLFYQQEIKKAFFEMRKTREWKAWVYGGESGIEITKRDNGLHIHIHGLLFVKKGYRNRSKLNAVMLRLWNAYTIDKGNKRKEFSNEEIEAIKKASEFLTDKDIKKLSPKGATLISLENIYTIKNGKREYATKFGSKEMLWAVMEAISYHFEPQAFDKENGEFNLPLLIEILPSMHNLRIFDRFGVLYGESPLAINNNTYAEEFKETLEARAKLEAENGELHSEADEYEYFITNPAYVFHSGDDKNNKIIIMSHKAENARVDLGAFNTSQAIEEMTAMVGLMHKTQG